MTTTMAKVHARWWVQAQIIAHTLAETNDGEQALVLFRLLDDLEKLWCAQFGEEFKREIAGFSGLKTEENEASASNLIPFRPGGKS